MTLMRRRETVQKINKIAKIFIRCAASVLAVCSLLAGSTIHAGAADNNADEIRRQYDEAVARRNQTQSELQGKKEGIAVLKENKDALEGKMNALESNLSTIGQDIKSINDQIKSKEEIIEETERLLKETQELKEKQYEEMKIRIRYIFEKQKYALQDLLLKSKSYTQLLNQSNYIEAMSAYDRRKLEEYKSIQEEITLQLSVLKEEKEQLLSLKETQESMQTDYFDMLVATGQSIAENASNLDEATLEAAEVQLELLKQQAEVDSWEKKLKEQLKITEEAKSGSWTDPSGLTFYENDLRWLANLIYTEAGNQPYEGQVAVGAVVINRVRSSRFSQNTIESVIKAPYQFSVWPSRLAVAYEQDWAATRSSTCYSAASEAMNGYSPVGNALFFCTVEIGPSQGTIIGAHIFY